MVISRPSRLRLSLSNWSTAQKATFAIAIAALLVSSTFVALNLSSTHPITPFWQIYQDPAFATNELYDSKAPNGTICWASTNASSVIQNTFGINEHVVFGVGIFPLAYNLTLAGLHNLWIDGQGTATKLVVSVLGTNVFNFGNRYVGTVQYPASNDAYNITISNILFDGNATTSAGIPTTVNNGFFIEGGSNVKITGCTFQYFSNHALVISEQGNATGVDASGNFFYKNNLYDIAFAGTVGGNTASDNNFYSTWGIQTWAGNIITYNVFNTMVPTSDAVWTEVGLGNNIISDNQFLTCQTAILIVTNNNIIKGNVINNPQAVSAVVVEANYNLIEGNTIQSGGSINAFVLITANFNMLNGNYLYGTTNSIYTYSGTNNTVTGNNFYGCTYGLLDSATGTAFIGNFVYSTTTPISESGSGSIQHNNILNGVWTP